MNKRTKYLLVVLVILLAFVGYRNFGGKLGGGSSAGGGTKPVPTQIQKVNRGHLRVESLYDTKGSLKSVGQDPFVNPLLRKDQPQTTTPPVQQQPLPEVMQRPQRQEKPQGLIDIEPSMKREQEEAEKRAVAEAKRQQDYQKAMDSNIRSMKVKAIASTGEKKIAVVEMGGKTSSVFVGSAVGNFIVTDIDEAHVYLQNFEGYSAVLDLGHD